MVHMGNGTPTNSMGSSEKHKKSNVCRPRVSLIYHGHKFNKMHKVWFAIGIYVCKMWFRR